MVREGMPVEGARVVFRVNNGNLIQYGTENLPVSGAPVPPTRLTAGQARAIVARYIGGFQAGDTMLDPGSLHLVPSAILSARSADGYDFGNGRGLAKVWQVTFRRQGVMGTWAARVDATSGELLSFDDANQYVLALVSGGGRRGPTSSRSARTTRSEFPCRRGRRRRRTPGSGRG